MDLTERLKNNINILMLHIENVKCITNYNTHNNK